MGRIATQALLDLAEALEVEEKGGEINLIPPSCQLNKDPNHPVYIFRLPVYGKHVNLMIRFTMDNLGFLTKVIVFESGMIQILSVKEESDLFDVYDWLWNRGYISHVE